MKSIFYAVLAIFILVACDTKPSETPTDSASDTQNNTNIDSSLAPSEMEVDTVHQKEQSPQKRDTVKQNSTASPQDTSKADPRIKRIINEKIRPKNQDTIKK